MIKYEKVEDTFCPGTGAYRLDVPEYTCEVFRGSGCLLHAVYPGGEGGFVSFKGYEGLRSGVE